jgi:hypothetical protein
MVYFFHLTEGDEVILDPDGSMLADLAAAQKVALEGVRSLVAEAVINGEQDYRGSLNVEDEHGAKLFTVNFACPIHIEAALLPAAIACEGAG